MKKLATFIIEDRYFDDLAQICADHLKYLPEGTDLFIYTSQEHIEKYTEELGTLGITATFKIHDKESEVPYSIKYIPGINQIMEDARMKSLFNMCMVMTKSEFWREYFDYERVLIFQRDTGLLREGIEEFFEWDYVGAPCYNFVKDQTIQNGGLSLRNPRTMEYVCRMYGWNVDIQDMMVVGQYSSASFFAEDIFFCLRMIKHNAGRLAPLEESKKFSCEMKYELGTLGYHNLKPYMTEEEVKTILDQRK